jgi:hypothetical protein
MASLDSRIDELYRLNLDEFTKSRNTLAKSLTGAERAQTATLTKPSVAAWAVNQLYWGDQPTYKALVDSSEKLRAAYRSVLNGRETDVRKPEQIHRAAIERAVIKTNDILRTRTGSASTATVESIRRILSALPTGDRPGRLVVEPEAAGFGLLTGVAPRVVKHEPAPTPPRREAPEKPRPDKQKIAAAEQELRKAREAVSNAAATAKKTAAALERAIDAEVRKQAELEALVKNREALEAQQAKEELESRRLANRLAAAELASRDLLR